jgi:hypothetical protein
MSVSSTPDGAIDDAIVLSAPGGSVVGNGIYVRADYELLSDCGMALGGYGYSRGPGRRRPGGRTSRPPASATRGAITLVVSANWTAATVAAGPFVVVTDFPAGDDSIRLNARRSGGATTVADDTSWTSFSSLWVRARLKAANGSDVGGAAHSNAYVLASDVVNDLLGRLLTRFDGANATVTATTYHIDQLAYIDGATPQQIMDDLLALESAMTWHAWGNTSAGSQEFEFVPWGGVRYEASVVDGFESPAPTDDLYNEVNVSYVDKRGRQRYVTRTQTVAALGTITRSYPLDLGDEPGSAANAQQAGDQFLAQHAAPPNAGTLTIARPIMTPSWDAWCSRGRSVPAASSGSAASAPTSTASTRPTVTGSQCSASSRSPTATRTGSASLELDAPVDDETTAIVKLVKKRHRRHGGK